jgi:hypothetical protein
MAAKKLDSDKFRKLSKAELRKIGASEKSERYIQVGKRVTKTTKTISRRAYDQARLGTTLEKAVRQRQSGERSYKTVATREAARKQRRTRDKVAAAKFERRIRNRRLKVLSPPTHRGKRKIRYERGDHSRPYRLTDERRYKLPALRQDKLDGKALGWDDWKAVVDSARETNDPALPRLLKSSGK